MVKIKEIDAIILTTTYKESIKSTINFLENICKECLKVKKEFNVKPVLVFEKKEYKKYLKIKNYFKNKKISPYILVNNIGSGFPSCLNYGIKNTNSRWILRIDTDDILCRDRILGQLKLMRDENLDMSSGYMKDDKGNILKYPRTNFGLIGQLSFGINPIPHPTVCFKRSSLFKIYNEECKRCEDLDLWINLFINKNFTWKCIESPLTIYDTKRSFIKDKENAYHQIKLRLKYCSRFLFIAIGLFLGIFGNIFRILIGNNFLLRIRRRLK